MVMSGSQRSKEDNVQKISTSVFVTNFPHGYGAKDLWNICKLYGHVVDVFIPVRRTKACKRFGFVRFIKILDIYRLINNLCTTWVERNKIHANVARFQRESLHKQSNKVNNKGTHTVNHGAKGKVKEFASLTNLKVVLGKEGYANIELKYMGDERVILVEVEGVLYKWWSRNTFSRITSRWGMLLNGEELEEESYHTNRIFIRTKLKTAVFDSFKMMYRGMTCWVRAIEVPGWVPNFEKDGEVGYGVNDGSHEDDMYGGVSENLKDVEGKSDREEVPETKFEEVPDKSIFEGNFVRQNDVHYEDLFGIYKVLNKKRDGKNIDDKHEDSLKYPPGLTPNEKRDVPVEKDDEVVIIGDFNEVRDISERFRENSNMAQLHKEILNSRKSILKAKLAELDGVIDKGEGSDADGHRRREVVRLIQEVEKVDAMEVAQKAKIKWSIEGDKNSKYYHGVLNKKKDFRPISLIGSLYKVIAKVLENRLVTVFDDIVDEILSAFVTDRQILDGPFILNKIVHWCKNKKKQSMIFKVDFEKAVVDAGLFNGIKLDSTLQISHLFYADDAIFMGQWSQCAIPIYHMSIFKVPIKVLQNMESIRARFFNGANVNSKKPRWKSVLAAKDVGGLENSLWVRVVKALHGEDGKIAWCGDIAFKNLVPRLRNPRGGVKQAQFERLKEMVEGFTLSNSNDRWSWSLVGLSDFLVSSVRKLIDNAIFPKGISKTRWIKEVPIKINVYAWKVIHDCLPTRFNISRRGIEIESILCPMCECSVESSRNLFFSCKMISDVMRKITRWWDLEYREINSFEDWCKWISSIKLLVKQKHVLKAYAI
nr:hypothetical protein [Tanacetum cinerariifolium]